MNIKKALLFAIFFIGMSQLRSLFSYDRIEKPVNLEEAVERLRKEIESIEYLESRNLMVNKEKMQKFEKLIGNISAASFIKKIEDIMAEYR